MYESWLILYVWNVCMSHVSMRCMYESFLRYAGAVGVSRWVLPFICGTWCSSTSRPTYECIVFHSTSDISHMSASHHWYVMHHVMWCTSYECITSIKSYTWPHHISHMSASHHIITSLAWMRRVGHTVTYPCWNSNCPSTTVSTAPAKYDHMSHTLDTALNQWGHRTHDAFMHSYVRFDAFKREIWCIQMSGTLDTAMNPWGLRTHDAFICEIWRIHMCNLTHSHVRFDVFTCQAHRTPHCIHEGRAHTTHSYVQFDAFICEIWCIHIWVWRIHMCDLTHLYVRFDAFTFEFDACTCQT